MSDFEDRWLAHLRGAFARDDLTAEQHEADVQDVLLGMPPRHFLATVGGMEPVYSDSLVPYDWIMVA